MDGSNKRELFEYVIKNVLSPEQQERVKLKTSILGITKKRYGRNETIHPNDIMYIKIGILSGVELTFKEFMKLPAKQHITIMQ